jgi:hypothetical protein
MQPNSTWHTSSLIQTKIGRPSGFISQTTTRSCRSQAGSKAKERREVCEDDDTITIEDTSEEEDGEMLQERFQL